MNHSRRSPVVFLALALATGALLALILRFATSDDNDQQALNQELQACRQELAAAQLAPPTGTSSAMAAMRSDTNVPAASASGSSLDSRWAPAP